MDWNPEDSAAYAHACSTQVQIELEAASYRHCKFTRARVAAKSNRPHVLWQLASSKEPMVVANVAGNPASPKDLIELISYWSIHQGDDWHAVRDALVLNWFTPHWMRAHITQREKARRNKIREEAKLPPLPEPELPKPIALSAKAQRRVDLIMLKRGNHGRDAVITKLGMEYFKNRPGKLVQKAFKNYKRRLAYRTKKKGRKKKKL